MSELYDASAADQTDRSSQINNVYIYKGGKVDKHEKQKVEHVRVHESVSVIDDEAFAHCYSLQTVEFSKNHNIKFKKLGKKCFYQCHNLFSINLQDLQKLETIGDGTFYNCQNLVCLNLQTTSIEAIGENAFQSCENLEIINFPKTLKYIGDGSFGYCTRLKSLNLKCTSIEKIGDGTFENCTNLETVIGIISTTSKDDEIVPHDDDAGNMILPASLVEIGENSFSNCHRLANKFDNNWIHYECDINHGGQQFLHRHHHRHDEDNNAVDNDGGVDGGKKVYHYSSLWPLILHRVLNKMELPQRRIYWNYADNLSLYASAKALQRQASVVYYLLVHGVVADLQSQQSGNNIQAKKNNEHVNKKRKVGLPLLA